MLVPSIDHFADVILTETISRVAILLIQTKPQLWTRQPKLACKFPSKLIGRKMTWAHAA